MEAFNELKLKHSFKYIIYALNSSQTEIEVVKKGDKDASYDSFLEELPENDCRYAIFDYEFEDDGRKQSKILFVVWAPDTAKIKPKMLYASSKANFKKKLGKFRGAFVSTRRSRSRKTFFPFFFSFIWCQLVVGID